MAAAQQSSPRNPMSTRLGLFTSRHSPPKAGPSSPLSREADEDDEDWYIPYNGPYERPKGADESRESWGALLNGIISETDPSGLGARREERTSHAASAPEADRSRHRAVSGASRLTSTEPGGSSRRTTMARKDHARPNAQPRAPTMSYIDPNQAGGVGESPQHIERTSSQPTASTSGSRPSNANRNSLASIFAFGRKSLRVSASVDSLAAQQRSQDHARGRSNSHANPPLPASANIQRIPSRPRASTTTGSQGRLSPEDEYYNTYYSTLLATPGRGSPTAPAPSSEGGSMRSHPYAYPFPSADIVSTPQSAPAVDKGKGRLLVPRITLLDPRDPKVPDYLKPSPRNSVLKVSMSTPNLRHLPKGKQKWLSAETWCDAIILPRPRFAMRLIDEQGEVGSGRIVSPPPSPLASTYRPNPMTSLTQRPSLGIQKSLKKARSMGNLSASPSVSHEGQTQQREFPPVASTSAAPPPPRTQDPRGKSSPSRPYRPKSWALDDLALPLAMPSLTEVVKQGQQLEEDRKAWKSQANRSFLDKRAGSISRSRSKSISGGGSRARPRSRARSRSGERTTAFEALAERTLLGGQIRPPTIHVHGPPKVRSNGSHSRSLSQSQTQTQTQTMTAQSATFNSSGQGSRRTKSHAHSNSLGQTTFSSKESRPGVHTRSHSLGKSAFKIAASAAAFCGLTNPSGEKGLLTPENEKAVALEGAIHGPGTKHIHLHDQILAEQEKTNVDLAQLAASPSAMLSMLNRSNGVSPTPSGLSSSGEGVGIAITSPSVDQHTPQPHREPIRFPAHPYALNAAYVSAPSHAPHPSVSTTNSQQGSKEDASVTSHRQPVLLHPYSQPTHPYAMASNGSRRPMNIRPPPPQVQLYAALTPDHVREFAPEDLRYSPDIPTPVVVKRPSELPQPAEPSPKSPHPYGDHDSKRTSELGFGEALAHTLRRSIDSGIGASETEHLDPMQDWNPIRDRPLRPDSAMDDIIRIHAAPSDPRRMSSEVHRPSPAHTSSGGAVSMNNTTASSPPEHLNPPLFRSGTSSASLGTQFAHSSGSSPGAVSHDSSPPLSPRAINTSDDLERFKDLFYRPERRRSQDSRPSMGSRQTSGSIILDVGSQRSTRSGLSTLARQLSEELEELRQEYGSPEHDRDSQRSWGRRFGGLRGPQPDEVDEDTSNRDVVLAQLSNSPEGMRATDSPVQMPIDVSFVSPEGNIPEDVESSRASSILEISPLNDEVIEHFRLGEVEAVSTPPIVTSTARFSAELSLVGHDNNPEDNTLRVDVTDNNHRLSERSTRLSPLSPYSLNTRSSYRTSGTDTSRMSGLSDFPAPPTLLPSRLHYVHQDPPQGLQPDRPRLERESSYATFGQNDDEYSTIGQAL